jgi:hypothetical protein
MSEGQSPRYLDMNAPTPRVRHWANKIRSDGAASAACFTAPRAIDMTRATWTSRPEAATCPKCRKIIDARQHPTIQTP